MEKKILILIKSLYKGGGAERIAHMLSSNLSSNCFDIHLFTFFDNDFKYDYDGKEICLKYRKSGLLTKKPFDYTLGSLIKILKIKKYCEKENIDIILSFLPEANYFSILSKVLFRNKTKIIVSVRNNPLYNSHRILTNNLYPKADCVVTQTKKIEYILNNNFSINNTTVIPNMVDINKIKKLSNNNLPQKYKKIFNNNFIFINIASLTKQKGQWNLIRSFKKTRQKNKNVKLIILGEGSLKNRLKKLVQRLDLEDDVLFLGRIDNPFPYLKESNCFVFPSLYEGFPNALTEALTLDIPVISTDCVSGPREILCPHIKMDDEIKYPYYGKYGILIKTFNDTMIFKSLNEEPLSKNEKLFAQIMIKMIENKDIQKKYSNGFERVKDFKLNKILPKWKDILRDI